MIIFCFKELLYYINNEEFLFFNKDNLKMLAAFIAEAIIILPLTFLKCFDSFAAFSFNYGALLALIPINQFS